jgi:hypothetical protein
MKLAVVRLLVVIAIVVSITAMLVMLIISLLPAATSERESADWPSVTSTTCPIAC